MIKVATKILVVEDEGIEALSLQQKLKARGYNVPEIVYTGEDAIKKAVEGSPDLVLMDIMLHGGMDGIMAAEQIRARSDIPIIYITAYADDDTLKRAKITEPYGYIVKPFKERELIISIEMALYKHKIERELKESRRLLETTLKSIGDGVITTDKNGLVTFMNPIAEGLIGLKQEEVLNKELMEVFKIINRDIHKPAENPVTKVLEGITADSANILLKIKSGEEIPIESSAAPIKDERGSSLGVILVFRDVTEREKMQAALRESEQRWATTLASIGDAVISTDAEGRIIFMNGVAEKLTGWTLAEASAKPVTRVFNIINEYTRRKADNPVTRVLQEGIVVGLANHTILLRKDGTEVPIDDSGAPIRDRDGKIMGVVLIFRDITDQKQAEEALHRAHDELELRVQERTAELAKSNKALQTEIEERRRAEEQIREQAALLDKAHDAIALRDLQHRIIYWNKNAEQLYGWTADEVMGRNAIELLYKDEPPLLIEAKRSIVEKGDWTGELNQLTKDGRGIIVESRWTLIRDDLDRPKSILTINMDISEKKRLELQLLRAQRMESIGTLAGGIAHDLNNVLTPTMMSLRMLREKFKDEQSQKLLTILEKNSERGANLIKQVLSFSRGIEGERNPLEAKHIITEIEKIAKETFPRNIEIRTDIQKDLSTISGDATQLHQVIINLCVNARDAMPDGGILSITASNVFIDENYVRMYTEAKVGSYVVISVSDTGVGIPHRIFDRIFEPFFTTKEFGKGTGLGLSTSLAIVKSHGGFINVDSKVGKGSTFSVYLPATENEMENIMEQSLELLVGYGELVLVAEDEDSVREVTISTLKEYGYNMLTASDGAEAVALYAQNMDEIKVVLMDLMMPVMDGEASIRAIRKINPEVKIIVVSGLTEKDKLKNIAEYTNAFLPKPYTAERLLKTLHEVLSAK